MVTTFVGDGYYILWGMVTTFVGDGYYICGKLLHLWERIFVTTLVGSIGGRARKGGRV